MNSSPAWLICLFFLFGCASEYPTATIGDIDYDNPFMGTTRADVESFTEASGLMDAPEWKFYEIGYSRYLELCEIEDLYSQMSVLNLDQVNGARARTLFWQFLLMALPEVEETGERLNTEMIDCLLGWEAKKSNRNFLRSPLRYLVDLRQEYQERAYYIKEIEEVRFMKESIRSIRSTLP